MSTATQKPADDWFDGVQKYLIEEKEDTIRFIQVEITSLLKERDLSGDDVRVFEIETQVQDLRNCIVALNKYVEFNRRLIGAGTGLRNHQQL